MPAATARLAAQLNGAGWHVVGLRPARPRPQSGGPRGGLAPDDALLADLGAVVDHVRAAARPSGAAGPQHGRPDRGTFRRRRPGSRAAPAGRVRSTAWCCRRPRSTPAWAGFSKLLLALAGRWRRTCAVGNGLKPEWVCRDPEVVAAYVADPLVHDRITPRLARLHRRRRRAGARTRAALGHADAAAVGRRRPLRCAGRQRGLRRRRAAERAAGAAASTACSTRSSTSPSRARCWPTWLRWLARVRNWLAKERTA